MTKKHFIALADAIRFANRGRTEPLFTSDHLTVLADFCRSQNGQFMHQRWLDYIAGNCGPGGGTPPRSCKRGPKTTAREKV